MTHLIAITGKARAGKDTFAGGLIQSGYRRAAFADTLKLVAATIADEPARLYFDDATKEQLSPSLGLTRRAALQKLGSAVRDSLGADTWANRLLAQWRADGCPPTVITDCRYDNEAALVIAAGGVVIEVVRPEFDGGLKGEAALHQSEAGVSEHLVSLEVTNDGTVGDLTAEARKIAGNLNNVG